MKLKKNSGRWNLCISFYNFLSQLFSRLIKQEQDAEEFQNTSEICSRQLRRYTEPVIFVFGGDVSQVLLSHKTFDFQNFWK